MLRPVARQTTPRRDMSKLLPYSGLAMTCRARSTPFTVRTPVSRVPSTQLTSAVTEPVPPARGELSTVKLRTGPNLPIIPVFTKSKSVPKGNRTSTSATSYLAWRRVSSTTS